MLKLWIWRRTIFRSKGKKQEFDRDKSQRSKFPYQCIFLENFKINHLHILTSNAILKLNEVLF